MHLPHKPNEMNVLENIPDIFRGELLNFTYEMRRVNDEQVAIVIAPSMFPFLKLALPFHRLAFAKFMGDCQKVVDSFAESDVQIDLLEDIPNGPQADTPDSDL